MAEYNFYISDSMEKVFADEKPKGLKNSLSLSALNGEIPAFQLVYLYEPGGAAHYPPPLFTISLRGFPIQPRLRSVELMPSDFPAYEKTDGNYLRCGPGLFPDLLLPLKSNSISLIPGQYRSIWLDFPDWNKVPPGIYDCALLIDAAPSRVLESGREYIDLQAKEKSKSLKLTLKKIDANISDNSFYHTEWFHADCLADYYKEEPFSEEHWRIIENNIAFAAVESRVSMLLTPVFTPALDTAFGGERTTVQLADVYYKNGEYSFDFEKLGRWCGICKDAGIEALEIPPFFSQWGAEYAPKIIAQTENGKEKLFGWQTSASSPYYRAFLESFIPALQNALKTFGYGKENVYYHISDEPEDLEKYMAARSQVVDLLDGCNIIDALSSLEFYSRGLVKEPVVANDSIQPFIDSGVENLWVYYCCGQSIDVPNRYFSMPGSRSRIMGILMYLYNIKGFLHWGFNFYNSRFSLRKINPFIISHADYAFPSGDAFLVYPGDDGYPLSSIRNEHQRGAVEDYLALKKLEEIKGREFAAGLICELAGYMPDFNSYPHDSGFILKLREKINEIIVI